MDIAKLISDQGLAIGVLVVLVISLIRTGRYLLPLIVSKCGQLADRHINLMDTLGKTQVDQTALMAEQNRMQRENHAANTAKLSDHGEKLDQHGAILETHADHLKRIKERLDAKRAGDSDVHK